jgi:hypothetical protein
MYSAKWLSRDAPDQLLCITAIDVWEDLHHKRNQKANPSEHLDCEISSMSKTT